MTRILIKFNLELNFIIPAMMFVKNYLNKFKKLKNNLNHLKKVSKRCLNNGNC